MSLALTSSDQHQLTALLVALTYAAGVGAKTARSIVTWCCKHHIKAEDLWDNLGGFKAEIGLSEKIVESIQNIKKEHNFYEFMERVMAKDLQLLPFFSEAYPKLLLATDDYPALLFIQSAVRITDVAWSTLFARTIAIVGTRKMTSYGQLVLAQLVPPLVGFGYTVISGFMYGVDLEAARLAVTHDAQTIAVLGYGHDHCFPKWQRRDREAFLAKGAVFLSEYPPEFPPLASNFVMRNRIVAGLTAATLVIEAAVKSGSHITANYANEYGRLVMAVPGPITNPFSIGTKALIDQGAVLVTSAHDVLSALADDYGLQHFVQQQEASSLDKKTNNPTEIRLKAICDHLRARGGMSFTELLHACQLDDRSLNQFLFDLELQGRISKQHGTYCLKL